MALILFHTRRVREALKQRESWGADFFFLLMAAALVGGLIAMFSGPMLILIALGYLVSGVLARMAYGWGRERRRASESAQSQPGA